MIPTHRITGYRIAAAGLLGALIASTGCSFGDAARDGFFSGITEIVNTLVTTTILGM